LRLGPHAPDATEIASAAAQHRIPLEVLDVPDTDARDLYGRDLVLIRPDHYVAWRGNRPPADCDALLTRLTGH
jgi:aromatic ring hydroxylase-like protein